MVGGRTRSIWRRWTRAKPAGQAHPGLHGALRRDPSPHPGDLRVQDLGGRGGARPQPAARHPEPRAVLFDALGGRRRRLRQPHRPGGGPPAALRLRPAGQRHPHRAQARAVHRPAAHRRAAAHRPHVLAPGPHRDHLAAQEPGAHGHRREAPSPGRPHQDRVRRQEVEIRVSTLPVAFGEKAVLRIFDPALLEKDLPDLGIDRSTIWSSWKAFWTNRTGIFLVTGPTGSGKTTTLYAALKRLATEDAKRLHRRGPHREHLRGFQPGGGAPADRAHLRAARCARCCARTPTSSWWAKSATPRRRRWRSRRRSPGIWCSPRFTPTTRPAPSGG